MKTMMSEAGIREQGLGIRKQETSAITDANSNHKFTEIIGMLKAMPVMIQIRSRAL
jgi:hypothetical protein